MKRVYVAGAMSANNILDVLGNLHRGIKLGAMLLSKGYAPYVPHLDAMFKVILGDELEVPLSVWYEYTMQFLKVCDIVLVVPKSENSKGTIEEIAYARSHGIPVYYCLKDLLQSE